MSDQAPNRSKSEYSYHPSKIEAYITENLISLGYNTTGPELAETCPIILNESTPIHGKLQEYLRDLEQYNELVQNFEPIPDLRLKMDSIDEDAYDICAGTNIHPEGLEGVFVSGQASSSSDVGYMEPLLPVMRSEMICINV